MHGVLNIDKKIKLITQFRQNARDESFKLNLAMIRHYLPNNNEKRYNSISQKVSGTKQPLV
jgi:hypothetical protein